MMTRDDYLEEIKDIVDSFYFKEEIDWVEVVSYLPNIVYNCSCITRLTGMEREDETA